jgi:flavin reductase (DIM6/NTAB) family NADH-FMN oxidoreductase RutF
VVNAAPFSFFNMLGGDPPILGIGVGNLADGTPKDSARNAVARGEFVVNLVDERLAEAMNVTAVSFPAGVSEVEEAGLTMAPSLRIATPRLAEAPASLECRLAEYLRIGTNNVLIGEIVAVALRDDLVDTDGCFRTEDAGLIARMHGGGGYARTSDRFRLDRLSLAEWEARKGAGQ